MDGLLLLACHLRRGDDDPRRLYLPIPTDIEANSELFPKRNLSVGVVPVSIDIPGANADILSLH